MYCWSQQTVSSNTHVHIPQFFRMHYLSAHILLYYIKAKQQKKKEEIHLFYAFLRRIHEIFTFLSISAAMGCFEKPRAASEILKLSCFLLFPAPSNICIAFWCIPASACFEYVNSWFTVFTSVTVLIIIPNPFSTLNAKHMLQFVQHII